MCVIWVKVEGERKALINGSLTEALINVSMPVP